MGVYAFESDRGEYVQYNTVIQIYAMYGMSLVIIIIIPERQLPIIPSPHYIISRIVYRSILLLVAKKHPSSIVCMLLHSLS